MKSVNPYLNFRRETAEAFRFYGEVFGVEPQVVRFRDFGEHGAGLPEHESDLVMHAYLPLGDGFGLMASDVPDSLGFQLEKGNNFHVMVEASSADEARRWYERLAEGGEVQMPLAETDWAELYANLADRFGVGWVINYTGSKGQ